MKPNFVMYTVTFWNTGNISNTPIGEFSSHFQSIIYVKTKKLVAIEAWAALLMVHSM